MCGRYALYDKEEIQTHFHVKLGPSFDSVDRFNISPGSIAPVVTANGIEMMHWGLVPPWAKDTKIGYSMFNAMAETIHVKPSFRTPFKFRRCLIPARGFYEWLPVEGTKEKIPYYFQRKGGGMFSFAGLYEVKPGAEGVDYKSFTIITTVPNKIVRPIHDRMPVIFGPDEEKIWLNPDLTEPEQLLPILVPAPDNFLQTYPVEGPGGRDRPDGPAMIKPL